MSFKLQDSNGDVLFDDLYLIVWALLSQIHDALLKIRNRELKKYGITIEYSWTLSVVKRLGRNATPTEISKRRYRRPHTISKVLYSMERDGLITRSKDLDRKNVVRITLTKKGENIRRRSIHSKSIKRIFSCLSKEEKERIGEHLEMLRSCADSIFAKDYNTKRLHEQQVTGKLNFDFWFLVRKTNSILREISNVISNIEQHRLTTGNRELDKIKLVRVALTEKCFSPEELVQLSEYLMILRNKIDHELNTTIKKYNSKSTVLLNTRGIFEEVLWYKLRSTYDITVRIRDKELAYYGLSNRSVSVLSAIKILSKEATPVEIAKLCLRSYSTIYSFLIRMQAAGLIRNLELNSDDRRKKTRVILTRKGKQSLEKTIQAVGLKQLFSCLVEEELEQLCSYLVAVRNNAVKEFGVRIKDKLTFLKLAA